MPRPALLKDEPMSEALQRREVALLGGLPGGCSTGTALRQGAQALPGQEVPSLLSETDMTERCVQRHLQGTVPHAPKERGTAGEWSPCGHSSAPESRPLPSAFASFGQGANTGQRARGPSGQFVSSSINWLSSWAQELQVSHFFWTMFYQENMCFS